MQEGVDSALLEMTSAFVLVEPVRELQPHVVSRDKHIKLL